jgi:hypothetical protein
VSAAAANTGPDAGTIRAFCDELTERAGAALATGSVDRYLRFGDAVVHLRAAGDALGEVFTPALAHADGPPVAFGPHDVQVWAWDRAATGVEPPPPAWSLDDHLPTGAIRGCVDGPVRIIYDRWQRVLTVYDRAARRCIYCAADAAEIPAWVQRSPLRQILTAWAAERGGAMVHAGTVATEHGAVVLAGASGSGKSTTTLTCAAAGFGFLGDDACLVTFDPVPMAHTVFGRAKLEPDAFERLGDLAHLVVGSDAGAPVLDPARHLLASAPLRAVALLDIGDTPATTAVRVGPSTAMRRLVEGALDEGAATTLAGLRRLAAEVPCVALTLGSDPAGVIATVGRLAAGDLP